EEVPRGSVDGPDGVNAPRQGDSDRRRGAAAASAQGAAGAEIDGAVEELDAPGGRAAGETRVRHRGGEGHKLTGGRPVDAGRDGDFGGGVDRLGPRAAAPQEDARSGEDGPDGVIAQPQGGQGERGRGGGAVAGQGAAGPQVGRPVEKLDV